MNNLIKSISLLVLVATVSGSAQAGIVEPFTGGQLSAPGWSQGIGADASQYLTTAAPDNTYGTYLVEDQWSYNTNIQFLPGETLTAWINPGPSPASNNNYQGGRLYVGFDAGATGAYSFVAASDTLQLGFQDNSNSYATPGFSNAVTQNYLDQWYLLSISLSANGSSATANLYDTNGTTLLSSLTETGLSATDTGIALRGNGGAVITSIAIVPEPSIAVLLLSGVLALLRYQRPKA